LKNNEKQNYYWIDWNDSFLPPNAVISEMKGITFYPIARANKDGRAVLGTISQKNPGMILYPDERGILAKSSGYQILVCDPEPAHPCGKL
jgi:hypothetical protein